MSGSDSDLPWTKEPVDIWSSGVIMLITDYIKKIEHGILFWFMDTILLYELGKHSMNS